MAGGKLDRLGRSKRIVRLFWENLAEDPGKMIFNSHLRQSFNNIPEVVENMKFALTLCWRLLEAVVARSLVLVLG